jgi:Transcriptional regulator C-terminal region
MLCGEGISRFQKLVKEYLAEVGEAKVRELTPANQQLAVPPAMYVQYVAGAVISTLAWWLEHDMPYSPQHMAQYLLLLHGTPSYHS